MNLIVPEFYTEPYFIFSKNDAIAAPAPLNQPNFVCVPGQVRNFLYLNCLYFMYLFRIRPDRNFIVTDNKWFRTCNESTRIVNALTIRAEAFVR